MANKTLQYTFEDHVRYLDAWFEAVLKPDEKVHLVVHGKDYLHKQSKLFIMYYFLFIYTPLHLTSYVCSDWGSALGFHYARRYPHRILSVAYMEALTAPIPDFDQFPPAGRKAFGRLRTPGVGEEMVLKK